ncbi:hypothetical protein B0H11DRAFT_2274987 [Mycena galericulata]|nr:hypothetical protein B0H11DRAFT_2274987 [Mycena galericulata]
MHPALSLSRLSILPFSARRVANVATNESTPDQLVLDALGKLRAMAYREPDPGQFALKLLPVLYATLDPRRMPDPDMLATESTVHLRVLSVLQAMCFLYLCLGTPDFPSAIIRELWPRTWKWVQFMDNHDCLPDSDDARCRFLSYLGLFLLNPTAAELVHATPDVRFFVARAWAGMVGLCEIDDKAIRREKYLEFSFTIVGFLDACRLFPQHFEELADGAGGSLHDLAALVVRYIIVLIRGFDASEEPSTDQLLTCFLRVLSFIRSGSDIFSRRLAASGLIRVLTQALISLADAGTSPEVRDTLGACLLQLNLIFDDVHTPQLLEAIKAGLLRAIILCSARHGSQEYISFPLNHFLSTVLIESTLEYPIMISLASALPEALAIENTRGFRTSPCFEKWQFFAALATERLRFLKEFQSRYISMRACDNWERPSSVAPHAGHTCTVLAIAKRSLGKITATASDAHAADRNDRFYNFALLRDYQTRKLTILLEKLKYIHLHGDTNFCVVMEYVCGRCTPRVEPIEEWKHVDHPSRARSAGRVEMHVARFVGGAEPIELPLVLRCNTSALTDGLVRIAREIPAGADVAQLEKLFSDLYEEVQSLAKMEVLETYS